MALLWLCLVLFGPGHLHAQSIESVIAPGPVIEGHAKVEHECKSCHVRFERAAQDGLCGECHKDVAADIRQRIGFHGRREQQPRCRSCHSEHKGRTAQLAAFDAKTFDHRATDFVLRDKHLSLDCRQCHVPGKRWREAPDACVGCHFKDDVHKGGLGRSCDECHNAKAWRETDFDHARKTRFALTDKHADVKCDACHAQGRFKDTARTCIGCHRKDDDHKGLFGTRCETCHAAKGWKPSTFNHDTDTRYLLKDKHRAVKCNACHAGGIYRVKTGSACVDCHARDDKHKETLGRQCGTCHSESGWKDPPGFDHGKSRFPLLGSHARVPCKECHADAMYRQAPTRCIDCHRKVDRHEGTLGASCGDCHAERAWKPVDGRFDHDRTRFPLRNAHAQPGAKCQDCHETQRAYRNAPTTCLSCHRRDDRHEGTLGPACEQCHRDVSWKVGRFDHARTRFPLAGRHLIATCQSCHTSLRFREVASNCDSCHHRDDAHRGGQGAACETCHNVRAWSLWSFDHDRATRYALQGRHRQQRCEACHNEPAPAGRPIAAIGSECLSCHRKDDVHEGRFGRRCEQCHAPEQWRQARTSAAARPSTSASAPATPVR